MASIKVPTNVTSITFATSGVKVPDADSIVSGLTSAEVTALRNRFTSARLCSTDVSGNLTLSLPVVITNITIDGVAYAVNGAVTPYGKCLSAAVPAVAGSQFLYQNFSLVTG